MGPTIYTNPEYEQMGYSGMFWQEFDHQGFHFRVTSGSTSYGGAPSIRAYSVDVTRKQISVLYMYVYDEPDTYGYNLYEVISQLGSPLGQNVQESVGNSIMVVAMEHIMITNFLSSILDQAYSQGKSVGKEEAHDAIKQALGL